MKRYGKIIAAAMIASLMATGCGAADTPQTEAPQAQETAEETVAPEDTAEAQEEASEDASETASSTLVSLPGYVYTGSEEYLDVISEYMIKDAREWYDPDTGVYIPFSFIAGVDDADPEDIKVYGEFDIDGYDLLNTTLACCNGGRSRGVFHIKKEDDGSYTVVDAELPLTEDETVALFEGHDDMYAILAALTDDDVTAKRSEAIAEYVNTNDLNITQWQDYSWKPIAVLNAPETPEEEQFYDYTSEMGYSLTYDLREYSMSPSAESDMLSAVGDDDVFTGTYMVIRKTGLSDADETLQVAADDSVWTPDDEDATADIDIADATIGDGIACRRAAWNFEIDDGRIFRYIGYSVPADEGTLLFLLETTYEEEINDMSIEDLDESFKSVLDSISVG
ncbi:MAG: hypothetical protein J5509_12045 [Lachnospiraceae bacterium]|nr:hypothetical protein [Lachnospiraceae bacterium]